MPYKLNSSAKKRYSRQLVLPNFGTKGQQKLSKAKVLVIGAGGLGSLNLLYLAAAGIGTLGIADRDKVELSNLARQVIHSTKDLGKLKTNSVKSKINKLNPNVDLKLFSKKATSKNIFSIIKCFDLIIDATDNFKSKFLINDAALQMKKPFIHAGVSRYEGQVMFIIPGQTACYRCYFKKEPPKNSYLPPKKAGILGTVAGLIGLIQATEAIKYFLGIKTLLTSKLLIYDALKMSFRTIDVKKDPNCPACKTYKGD